MPPLQLWILETSILLGYKMPAVEDKVHEKSIKCRLFICEVKRRVCSLPLRV